MKRYWLSILILLLAAPAYGQGWQESRLNVGVVGGGVAAAPAGDSCTGTLLFSHHFENNDAADTNANGTQGCSVGDNTITKNNYTTFNNAIATTDGSYYLNNTTAGETAAQAAVITNTNMTGIDNTGTWCANIYQTGTGAVYDLFALIDSGPYSQTLWQSGTSDYHVSFTYGATCGGTYPTSHLPQATWTRLCLSWDVSPANGARKVSMKIGGDSYYEWPNCTTTARTNAGTYAIAGASWAPSMAYFDNMKIYSDYQHAE